MEGVRGGGMQKGYMEGVCGGDTWRGYVEGYMEGVCGGGMWRGYAEGGASLFVHGYHWLPLATIDLVGDNREFEV